jgi:hypothetical protein
MSVELKRVLLKAAAETALYLSLVLYGFFLAPWIVARIRARTPRRFLRAVTMALLWALGWTILAAPFLLRGYGYPLYSTWVGPGALSWSGPYLCSPSFSSGLTVSYRGLFEAAAPCFTADMIGATSLPQHLPKKSVGFYLWLLGVIVYGIMGPVCCFTIRSLLRPRELPLCPKCNTVVQLPNSKRGHNIVAPRCHCGRLACAVYPCFECFLLGHTASLAWVLLALALVEATDVHGRARIAIAVILLATIVVYGAIEMWRGIRFCNATYPTSRLARSHVGPGVGILCYSALMLLASLLPGVPGPGQTGLRLHTRREQETIALSRPPFGQGRPRSTIVTRRGPLKRLRKPEVADRQ